MLGKVEWIDSSLLIDFIVSCQDKEIGGISDRPGNMTDIFHTFFGLSGLSLLGEPGFNAIDPVYALPVSVLKRCNIPTLIDKP